jgi:ubiquinone/menaquinone biosynthesis C-methylase UbiE
MNKRTFDDFNGFARNYREIHSKNVKFSGADSFYFAEMKVKEVKKYENDSSQKLLDFGCGDGVTEMYFNRYNPLWNITGIDIAEENILEAKKKNIDNTNFLLFDGVKIPFENESFDIVFVASVLHHSDFELHRNAVAEMYRVLKPGGRLYLFEHNPLNPITRYMVNTCEFDKDAKLLKPPYTQKLLTVENFTKPKLRFILFFPRWKIFKFFLPIEKMLSWLPLGGQYYYRATK